MTPAEHGLTELDVLSPVAATILRNHPSECYRKLTLSGPAPEAATKALSSVTPASLLSEPPKDIDDAKAMLAGLWLWFDDLETSHKITQELISVSGSYWHAILHRREGDFSNAKYWYARSRTHTANRILGSRTGDIAGPDVTDPLIQHIVAAEWDGEAFVDLVEAVHQHPDDPRYEVAVKLQQAEWYALFHHCALAAAGSPED